MTPSEEAATHIRALFSTERLLRGVTTTFEHGPHSSHKDSELRFDYHVPFNQRQTSSTIRTATMRN